MPRPSARIDEALLASGRALFPAAGCAGLSLRAVAEHAGVNVGMFHYHFKSKDNFLRALLQQLYEEMFSRLSAQASLEGPAIERLRAALHAFARFLRKHRRIVARMWMDAMSGQAVARDFVRSNLPRHVGVLLALLDEAEREGSVAAMPPLQRLMALLGTIGLPMVFAAGLFEAAVDLPLLKRPFQQQVMSEAAVAQRIDWVLNALRPPIR
jgi:AcrR family transcriptional regulator